jgi:hypothetical protein
VAACTSCRSVVGHGIFAFVTIALVLLVALGIGGS